ncbi:MAG: hypothetical protein GY716_05615 [bacterium]|nr:hypothetical protein [bacterium]
MKLRRAMSIVGVLVVTTVLLGACGARQPMRGTSAPNTDRKLSTFVYIEEGDLLTFVVGTKATRYRDRTEYIPLEISVANRGLRQLTLTRESFTLIDEEGNRYPAAMPAELIKGYEFLDLDRTALAELQGVLANKYAAYTRYASKFSPTQAVGGMKSNLVRDRTGIPRHGYILDFLYFPAPATGVKDHRFELFLDAPELPDPVFLKFEVK